MNLKELDSFKMSDAVTFHDKLNPKLWSGMHLRHEVEKQLKIIAEDFMTELGISGLNVEDITVSGSNAAYSYTPHSDLDLHIIVDMGKLPNDEVYKELFNAKKTLYNDSHDVKVHGVPVELYVQDSREPVKSLGEYSLLRNEWIKFPTKRRANFDQTATKAKFEKLAKVIELALKSKNLDKIQEALKTIKRYRQAGLEKGGEFGPENLAFKAIRSQGLITKLYQLRDELHSDELSIESMYETKKLDQPTLTPEQLVSLHGVSKMHILQQLDMGIKIEKEHTTDRETAREIALDHLREDPNYYTKLQKAELEEGASGYIPSEKEKNDPRFKTALTVDVKPDTIKKNAKAFGFNVSRAGIPPLLRK